METHDIRNMDVLPELFFFAACFFVPVQSHEGTHMTCHDDVGFVAFVRRSFTQYFRYLEGGSSYS